MLAFLTIALAVASAGGAGRAAAVGRRRARRLGRGSTRRLYALVCLASGLLTCIVSLDGAVVLMVPVVRALALRCRVPFAPFFLGAVAVANAASLAVPLGNPTNLVVMSRLGLSPGRSWSTCSYPACAPRSSARSFRPGGSAEVATRTTSAEDGPQKRRPLFVPWRIGAQLTGLVAALDGLGPSLTLRGGGLATLLVVAGGAAAASALANNLPVSAGVAALAGAGPGAYAALVGLTVGALATPHGSVGDPDRARPGRRARRAPLGAHLDPCDCGRVAVATLLLWASF